MQRFLHTMLIAGLFTFLAQAQTTILDFETPATSTTFQYFGSTLDGALSTVVANPNMSGINQSDSVTLFTKPADSQVWAGAFSNPNPTTPVDVTNGEQVCIKIHTDHPGNLALKLENSTTGGANWLQTVSNDVVNEWVELCFDTNVPSEEDPFTSAAGNIYETITLFLDFGTAFPTEQTYYLDDFVVQPTAVTCNTVLDFEAPATSTTFQYFGSTLDGALSTVTANPNMSGINQSDSVKLFIKPADSQVWAGAFSNPNPTTPVDVTNGEQVCIKLHTDHPGNLALKLENSTTGGANWIQTVSNDVVNEWVELCFDTNVPSEEDPFTSATGNIYSTVTLFLDFGTAFMTEQTYYLDDFQVCGGAVSTVDITFQVDMSEYSDPFTTVYLSGTMNAFSGTANPMSDDDLDGIWSTTLNLPTGSYEYLFTIDDYTDKEIMSSLDECTVTVDSFVNRFLAVSETDVLPAVCWESCYACGQSVNITFNLAECGIDVAETGLYIAGGGNFGNPGDYPLNDDDMDGVWTITVNRPIGFSSFFTFTNGNCPDYSCKENIAGQPCANPGNFNDRMFPPVLQDTVINTGFAQCIETTECMDTPDPGMITFRVDMSLYEMPFDTVYLSGSFNNWDGTAMPMSDADMDGIWEITIMLNGGTYEYKYTIDNWTDDDTLEPGSSCTVTDPSGQFTNRVITIDGDATLDVVCFNFCVSCDMVGLDELADLGIQFEVQPNVTNGISLLSFGEQSLPATTRLLIFDAHGRMLQQIGLAGMHNYTLDTSALPNGMYFLVLDVEGARSMRRLIKQ